jgi:glutathionylspermidine synthase
MERLVITPRPGYGRKLEEIGLSFWNWDDYWKEDVCYRFTAAEIDVIEEATKNLHAMCVEAVDFAIRRERLGQMGIPRGFWDLIQESFRRREPSLYGRFDLAYDGVSVPKMLEYNADTPTSLLESAVAQWYWLEEKYPAKDQFNSLHEKLIERWKGIAAPGETVHIASLADNEEDWVCTTYLVDVATQAGLVAKHLFVEAIGWDARRNLFVDEQSQPIKTLFKLYPWEWLVREEFGQNIPVCSTQFVEPAWKAVLACKGILPILWEMFPGHPNLLEAYFEPGRLASYAKKPLYSREGANVQLFDNHFMFASDTGPYGAEGHVYQALCNIPEFAGRYPVIGSWVVGDEPAGMCLREDTKQITTNLSNFVPHYFDPEE